jgi:hypothetical protein
MGDCATCAEGRAVVEAGLLGEGTWPGPALVTCGGLPTIHGGRGAERPGLEACAVDPAGAAG